MHADFDICVTKGRHWAIYSMCEEENEALFIARDIANNYKSVCVLSNEKMLVIYHHCKNNSSTPKYMDVRTSITQGRNRLSQKNSTATPPVPQDENPHPRSDKNAIKRVMKIAILGAFTTVISPLLLQHTSDQMQLNAMIISLSISIIAVLSVLITSSNIKFSITRKQPDLDNIWELFNKPNQEEKIHTLQEEGHYTQWVETPDISLSLTPNQAIDELPVDELPTENSTSEDDISSQMGTQPEMLSNFFDNALHQIKEKYWDDLQNERIIDGDIALTFYLYGAILTALEIQEVPYTYARDFLSQAMEKFDIPSALTEERFKDIDAYLQMPKFATLYRRGENDIRRFHAHDSLHPDIDALFTFWQTEESPDISDTHFRAILFTDIVNFSEQTRLYGEEWMKDVLKVHNEVARQVLDHYHGHEVKHTGDGILATFESASDAVRAAVNFQKGIEKFSETLTHRAFQVRVGISAGEIVMIENDVFGEIVNLSARIMSLSHGTGVLVSTTVRHACHDLPYPFQEINDVPLKGFENQTLHFIGTHENHPDFKHPDINNISNETQEKHDTSQQMIPPQMNDTT